MQETAQESKQAEKEHQQQMLILCRVGGHIVRHKHLDGEAGR